jgi:hypothetical protein
MCPSEHGLICIEDKVRVQREHPSDWDLRMGYRPTGFFAHAGQHIGSRLGLQCAEVEPMTTTRDEERVALTVLNQTNSYDNIIA